MNPVGSSIDRQNRLTGGLLALVAVCTGPVGVGVLMAVKFGRWPRTVLARFVVFAAAGLGLVGAVVGLVLGLRSYPPTAAFAVIELGLPSAMAGALVGLLLGSVTVGCKGVLRYRNSSI